MREVVRKVERVYVFNRERLRVSKTVVPKRGPLRINWWSAKHKILIYTEIRGPF